MKKSNLIQKHISETLQSIAKTLREQIYSKHEIVHKFFYGLKEAFGFTGISIYLFEPSSLLPELYFPEVGYWPFPKRERDWLIKRTRELLIHPSGEPIQYIYIPDRETVFYTDKDQLERDRSHYDYACQDGLYLVLLSEEELILGALFLNNWEKKERLDALPEFDEILKTLSSFATTITKSLDKFMLHKKIEGLLSDKKELKQRLQKDEEDLKRRILELTVLYESSNALGYSLDYYQIVSLIMDSLYKVLHFDACSIFLRDFFPMGEIITRVNRPMPEHILESIQNNTLAAVTPFFRTPPLVLSDIKVTIEKRYITKSKHDDIIRSVANVPLIFKEEVIGLLNMCSNFESAFSRNEMTFLHTMANQLSSHLGRIKIVKKLEKSKIASLIKSMSDGIIMLNENHHLDIINPAAMEYLGLESTLFEVEFLSKFKEFGLDPLYERVVKGEQLNLYELPYKDKVFSVNASTVFDLDKKKIGIVFGIRDVTEIQKINRIKTQRLDVISKVNLIIKSITDLDKLLTVLMEFILNIAHAEMGSIQLKKGKGYLTKVHSNFPDKIRREYKFYSSETISEYTTRTKDICFIENYYQNPKVNHKVKILIDDYLCIPILVKNNLVGMINIIRKVGNKTPKLTSDDIETLTTITSLSGTAIQNALLYKETLKKQKLDQELKIAYDIQTKLLPEKLPLARHFSFGAITVPAREIGGDYYDFFEFPNGNIGVVIADIIGKGIPAGLYMAMLKSILHNHIPSVQSPKEALKKINAILYHDPVIHKFIPLFYGILDPERPSFTYCNAGHEPGIHLSQNHITLLDTKGFPLGAFLESNYEEKEIFIQNTDIICLFTDGIIEAQNEKGIPFGRQHLSLGIKKTRHCDGSGIVDYLYSEIKNFSTDPQDDITLIAIKSDYSETSKINNEFPIKTKEIRVLSSRKNIKKIRQEVEVIGHEMGFSEKEIFELKLAVNEAQANVIEHAYAGNENGDILFIFKHYENRLEVIIKDFGLGINQKTIKGIEHLEELEGSGLGVFLIKNAMDEVKYNSTAKFGTELLLVKYKKKGEPQWKSLKRF